MSLSCASCTTKANEVSLLWKKTKRKETRLVCYERKQREKDTRRWTSISTLPLLLRVCWSIDLFRKKPTMGELFPIILGQTCWWLHTPWMNCSLFQDQLPASQVPPKQRFTNIFTIFWVSFTSFRCFDLRFSENITNNQNTAWRMFVLLLVFMAG